MEDKCDVKCIYKYKTVGEMFTQSNKQEDEGMQPLPHLSIYICTSEALSEVSNRYVNIRVCVNF